MPTGLHWAALFALDKLCKKLIADGLDVSQQSTIGTPLNCAIRSQNALCKTTEFVGEVTEYNSWHASSRKPLIQHLLDAGAYIEPTSNTEDYEEALLDAALQIDWSLNLRLFQCSYLKRAPHSRRGVMIFFLSISEVWLNALTNIQNGNTEKRFAA